MENEKSVKDELAQQLYGVESVVKDSLYDALVSDEMPKNQTLEEHDRRHHKGHFDPSTQSCKFREEMKVETEADKADEVDADREGGGKSEVGYEGKKSLVTAEEDAAYMEAVNNGDMKTAQKMVDAVAKRYFGDSAVLGKVWHNTKKKFTEFKNSFPNVFFFAKDKKWADKFGSDERYSGKENTKAYYLDIQKPIDMRAEKSGKDWLSYFEEQGVEIGENGKNKLERFGDRVILGYAILNHDSSEPYGTGFRDAMEAAGFDGAVFEDIKRGNSDRTTYGAFNSDQIKSGDAVTYYDDGSVVPLSKRFGGGEDIRFAIGKDEPFPYEQEEKDGGKDTRYSKAEGDNEFGDSFWESVYGEGKRSYSSQYGTDEGKALEQYGESFTKDGKYKVPFKGGKIVKWLIDKIRGNGGWDKETRREAEGAASILEKCFPGVKVEFADGEYEGDGDSRKSISGIYHGSAADFQKPSLLKVGTGNGAIVHGYGLYGSTSREVAQDYATMAAGKKEGGYEKNGVPIPEFGKSIESRVVGALRLWGDVDTAIEEMKDSPNSEELIKELKEHGKEYKEFYPHEIIYEQTLFTNREPGDESHLIDWSSEVSEDNKRRVAKGIASKFIDKLKEMGRYTPEKEKLIEEAEYKKIGKVNGQQLYAQMVELFGSEKRASEFLAKSDIDGIKYRADSHNDEGKEWNYVSFRDDNIMMDHKWVDGEQRYFKDGEGKVVGEYDRKTGRITLYPGATARDVVHEYAHGLWQFAEQEAKAGRGTLLNQIKKVGEKAPRAVKESVYRNYKDEKDPNVLLEECFTHELARKSEQNKEFSAAIKTAAGKAWYRRAWGTIKNVWKGFVGNDKKDKVDISKIEGMSANETAQYILSEMAKGHEFGTIDRPPEGGGSSKKGEKDNGKDSRKAIIGEKGAATLGIGR